MYNDEYFDLSEFWYADDVFIELSEVGKRFWDWYEKTHDV